MNKVTCAPQYGGPYIKTMVQNSDFFSYIGQNSNLLSILKCQVRRNTNKNVCLRYTEIILELKM